MAPRSLLIARATLMASPLVRSDGFREPRVSLLQPPMFLLREIWFLKLRDDVVQLSLKFFQFGADHFDLLSHCVHGASSPNRGRVPNQGRFLPA